MKSNYLLVLASLVLCTFLTAACGSTNSDGDNNSSSFKGSWVEQNVESPQYLDFASSRLTNYMKTDSADCYNKSIYDYEKLNGNDYVLTYRGNGKKDTTKLSVKNNTLTTESAIYKRTDVDVDLLSICD